MVLLAEPKAFGSIVTCAIILKIDGAHHVALRGIRIGDWTRAHLAMRYPHPSAAHRAAARFRRKHPNALEKK